jgi:pimeloyl-ACP methyl ester carboxylesterase
MSAALAVADLKVVRRGSGAPALLVHGSAADHTTWMGQLVRPPQRLAVIAYDRRGTAGAPFPAGAVPSTAHHVDDAIALIRREAGGGPVLVCGSSYGAVISLELARSAPALVAGLVLCEPPLPPADLVPAAPDGLGCAFDRLVATASGEDAAEMFLRMVMGDAGFEAVPRRQRVALRGMWRQIRADMIALARTRVAYADLAAISTPALLVGGERSPAEYAIRLDALEAALPHTRRALIPAAGHAMHIDNHRVFNAMLSEFAHEVGFASQGVPESSARPGTVQERGAQAAGHRK